jgi:tetratricopeptide (TPR) repeat protein
VKQPLPNTTIFVGAGVSLLSGLPDGAALGQQAFDLVLNSGEIILNDLDVSRLREAVKELRLEILLERLATEIPKGYLFAVFNILKSARPNLNHLAAVKLGLRSVVTTNQDLLLETASERLHLRSKIIHLHGRCDDRQSIITMIGQYLAGLRPSAANEFRRCLCQANVAVLGYSGRDGDVMSILSEGKMKSLTWIHHPGSKQSPELLRLKEQLGQRLKIIEEDAGEWLIAKIPKTQRSELQVIEQQLSPVSRSRSSKRTRTFRQLNRIESNLAIGRLIEHVGWYDLGLKLYSRLLRRMRRESAPLRSLTRIQLAIGRVQTYQYRFKTAATRYLRIAHDSSIALDQRCQAFVDCVFVLRNASRLRRAHIILSELESLLSKAPTSLVFQKFKGDALAARAGMLRIEGQATESVELYKEADKCFRRSRDVDGWLEVSTWLADNLIMLGRFREAAAYLRRSIDDSEAYGRYFSKAWSLFLRGELLGFSGDVAAGLRLIAEANRIFEQVNNPQGQVYCWLYFSDIVREESLEKSRSALRQAEKLLQKHDFAYATARFLMESAELARARSRSSEMKEHLSALEIHLGDKRRFSASPAIFAAHSRCIEAEYAREHNSADTLKLLERARSAYEVIRANHCIARIDVSRWLCTQDLSLGSRLIAICRREGYGHELKRLLRPTRNHYPLHFS